MFKKIKARKMQKRIKENNELISSLNSQIVSWEKEYNENKYERKIAKAQSKIKRITEENNKMAKKLMVIDGKTKLVEVDSNGNIQPQGITLTEKQPQAQPPQQQPQTPQSRRGRPPIYPRPQPQPQQEPQEQDETQETQEEFERKVFESQAPQHAAQPHPSLGQAIERSITQSSMERTYIPPQQYVPPTPSVPMPKTNIVRIILSNNGIIPITILDDDLPMFMSEVKSAIDNKTSIELNEGRVINGAFIVDLVVGDE